LGYWDLRFSRYIFPQLLNPETQEPQRHKEHKGFFFLLSFESSWLKICHKILKIWK